MSTTLNLSSEPSHTIKTRKRLAAGERRMQILQTLASMLEKPSAERITTATLAKTLQVSEAALYRHFASKAQMFEGLLEFIETSTLGLINQITEHEATPVLKAAYVVSALLQFADRNPGMTRVMVGDALVGENARLQARMNRLFDKIETHLRQILRQDSSSDQPTVQAQLRASVLTAYLLGCLQRYVRSGFKHKVSEQSNAALALILR